MLHVLDLKSPTTQDIASNQNMFALVLLKNYTGKEILYFIPLVETEYLFSI